MRLHFLLVQRQSISSTTRMELRFNRIRGCSPPMRAFSGFHPELCTLMPSGYHAKHSRPILIQKEFQKPCLQLTPKSFTTLFSPQRTGNALFMSHDVRNSFGISGVSPKTLTHRYTGLTEWRSMF